MFVSDLRHFLDITDDAPAPAKRMAHQLGAIVKAATARGQDSSWITAIGCMRRPNRRPCTGLIGVRGGDAPGGIRWECVLCGDEGIISGWEGSYADLRGGDRPVDDDLALVVPEDMAQVLQSLTFTDSHLERLVFAGIAIPGGIALEGRDEDFDELANCLAAEANHETGRLRRKQLYAAYQAIVDALAQNPDRPNDSVPLESTDGQTIHIRHARFGDIKAVLHLWKEADAEPTETDDAASLAALMKRDAQALLVAEAGQRLVGSVICGWDGWRGSIYRLVVSQDHRRAGLATRLIRTAEEQLQASGAVRLHAIVVEHDATAMAFWGSSGWDRQPSRARFVKNLRRGR